MMKIVYQVGIHLYAILLRLAALFHPKAQRWVRGRKDLFHRMEEALRDNTSPLLWFHAASLGEYEQGKPVMEKLKALHPHKKLLVTFFSPSGYEVRKADTLPDYVFYLPLDTPGNARKFLALAQPEAVFFIKYEFWYFFIAEIQRRQIPLVLFSAVFCPNQFFFRSYGAGFRKLLQGYTHIFVQNESSRTLLQRYGIIQCSVAFDTRFDRVRATIREARQIPIAARFKQAQKLLVIGSCWGKDLDVLLPAINAFPEPLKVIIAPHEIKESMLQRIEKTLRVKTLRYSQAKDRPVEDYAVLIIDNIGMLSALYRYGEVAYVGGAFGEGLHNVLEPATFGMPVIFGEDYAGFPEAFALIERKAAHSIKHAEEIQHLLKHYFVHEEAREEAGQAAAAYIQEHSGGTEKIIDFYKTTLAGEAGA